MPARLVYQSKNYTGCTCETYKTFGVCFSFPTCLVFEVYVTQYSGFCKQFEDFICSNRTHDLYEIWESRYLLLVTSSHIFIRYFSCFSFRDISCKIFLQSGDALFKMSNLVLKWLPIHLVGIV